MDQRHKPAKSAPKPRPAAPASLARGSGRQAPARDALRTRSYAEGRALVSPSGDVSGHAAVDLPSWRALTVDGVGGHAGGGNAGLSAEHVGVHKGSAERLSAGLRHHPSGLGARADATGARVHRADVRGAGVSAGLDGLNAQADHVSWLNTGAESLSIQADSARSGRRAGLDAQGLAIHQTDVRGADFHAGLDGANAHADDVRFVNVAADRFSTEVAGSHGRTGLRADDLQIHDAHVQDANWSVGQGPVPGSDTQGFGMRADAAQVDWTNIRADQVRAEHTGPVGSGHVAASDLAVHDTTVRGGTFAATRQGIDVRADEVGFVNTEARDLNAAVQTRGGHSASASVDALDVHRVGVHGGDMHLGRRGIQASADAVDFQNTAIHGARADWQGAGGAHGSASADRIAAHTLAVRNGHFSLDRSGISAGGAVDYRHAEVNGLNLAHTTAGGTTARAGVDQALVGHVHADDVQLDTDLISGRAGVRGASVVEHDLKGASLGLDRGGKTLVGASGDLHASHSADAASAEWDLRRGKLGASVDNYQHTRSLSNAQITVMGETIELPDVAVHLEADAEAALDVSEGEVELGLDLSGTSLKVGDLEVTLPEQAQLGIDMDLGEGNLDLNIGGHKVDVDQAIGRFWGRLKGLFGGGKAEKATPQEIQKGREDLRALGRGMPSLKRDVQRAAQMAEARRAA